jgi:hypothetical protein
MLASENYNIASSDTKIGTMRTPTATQATDNNSGDELRTLYLFTSEKSCRLIDALQCLTTLVF